MKKIFLLLFFVGTTIVFTNCNKDEDEDLTIEITGDYTGAYGNNLIDTIDPYEITITKIDRNHISVKPKSGNEFDEFEIEIARINSSSLASPTDDNQQLEKSVIFTISTPVGLTMSLNPTGDAHTFSGVKQ